VCPIRKTEDNKTRLTFQYTLKTQTYCINPAVGQKMIRGVENRHTRMLRELGLLSLEKDKGGRGQLLLATTT